jgi:hypothetical protein
LHPPERSAERSEGEVSLLFIGEKEVTMATKHNNFYVQTC